jgi:hypothetical protein
LEAVLPGYAALFGEKLWECDLALCLARRLVSPTEGAASHLPALAALLRQAGIRFQQRTLEKIAAWSANAAAPDAQAAMHQRIFTTLDDDRRQKTREIRALEQELAHRLAGTPYLLLLSVPGINVVSAAELAGEMGPIGNYAKANRITGRAGLYGSRYQSDEVDLKQGPLVRLCNHRLRAVLMMIADNLALLNEHYRGLAQRWRSLHQDERYLRTKIATRFSRLAFQLVSGRQVLRHPGMRGRDYILDKLLRFHQDHGTPLPTILADLQRAAGELPGSSHAEEAKPLVEACLEARASRRGPKPIADLLVLVLARLGVGDLQLPGEAREPS